MATGFIARVGREGGVMRRCTRILEFDAAHRVMEHESKCKNLHGHRYKVEITCATETLDTLGRVIDFGVIKEVVGGWIDEHWDHGIILNPLDVALVELCDLACYRYWTPERHSAEGLVLNLPNPMVENLGKFNPTAENIAEWLFGIAWKLLAERNVEVLHVRVWETPNCSAEYGT